MDLSLSVGCGKEWMGFATNKTTVLVLNFELHRHSSRKRKQAIMKAMKLRPGETDVYHWALRGALAQRREDPKKVYREIVILLEKYCAEHGVGMVIIDPIYKLANMAGEENKAEDVGRALRELEAIAANTGAAVVFAHHFAKGNAAVKDAIGDR